MKKPQNSDPLQARCLELCEQLIQHTQSLRDYALTPGDIWLARGELQQIGPLISQLETLLEEIKAADSNSG